jgi:class 3 adenylate cyclase
VTDRSEIRYANSGGVHIAYQTLGEGPDILLHAVHAHGLEVRAGVHTGEVELVREDIAGIAVHIGARVAALANGGEVLVSRTVTDLVAGSGLEFTGRGADELKGVPGRWQLYTVRL